MLVRIVGLLLVNVDFASDTGPIGCKHVCLATPVVIGYILSDSSLPPVLPVFTIVHSGDEIRAKVCRCWRTLQLLSNFPPPLEEYVADISHGLWTAD